MTITSMDHVLVLADDIDGTRDWYCRVVGLSVGERPALAFPGYWLYSGGGSPNACVHIAERRAYSDHAAGLGLDVPVAAQAAGPVDHVAFSASDWDALVARLDRCGVPTVFNAVPGGPRQVFVEDPNGVRVEISVLVNSEDEAR